MRGSNVLAQSSAKASRPALTIDALCGKGLSCRWVGVEKNMMAPFSLHAHYSLLKDATEL